MFKKIWINILILILCFFILVIANSYATPFHIPEKFIYDLSWVGIKAGTASLEIKNDGNKTKIISTARSAEWISIFYTVDDRVESTLLRNPSFSSIGQPVNYRLRLREGKHRKDKEVIFNNGSARYIDYLKNEKKEFGLPAFIFDPLSSFYYLRTLNLMVGKSVFISVFDSKKVWNVEVQVLRREKVTLPIGTFDTFVIKPLMKSEGLFYRKGDIFIWLTDDAKRIPVKMQTKVGVGHITATLAQGYY